MQYYVTLICINQKINEFKNKNIITWNVIPKLEIEQSFEVFNEINAEL
jgi:hypothetical protein